MSDNLTEKRTDTLLNSANSALKELKELSKKIKGINSDLKANFNHQKTKELLSKKEHSEDRNSAESSIDESDSGRAKFEGGQNEE